MNARVICAVVAMAVAVVGCSSDNPRASGAGSSSSPSSSSSSVVDQQSLGTVPNGYAARNTPGVWRLVKSDPNSSSVTVVVAESGCLQVDHMEAGETADTVSITAVMRVLDPTAANYTCSTPFNVNRLDVPLQTALGRRTVVGQCSPSASGDEGHTCSELPAT